MIRYSITAAAAFVVLVAACATSPSADPGAATSVAAADDPAADSVILIEVKHDRADGGIATIYVQPSAGVRSALGTIGAGETKSFRYRVEAENRNLTLLAINASGEAMRSQQITVPRGAGLVWSLQVNAVRVQRRR